MSTLVIESGNKRSEIENQKDLVQVQFTIIILNSKDILHIIDKNIIDIT